MWVTNLGTVLFLAQTDHPSWDTFFNGDCDLPSYNTTPFEKLKFCSLLMSVVIKLISDSLWVWATIALLLFSILNFHCPILANLTQLPSSQYDYSATTITLSVCMSSNEWITTRPYHRHNSLITNYKISEVLSSQRVKMGPFIQTWQSFIHFIILTIGGWCHWNHAKRNLVNQCTYSIQTQRVSW